MGIKCSFLILLLLGLSSVVLTAAERQVLHSPVPQAVAKLHSINRLAAASRLKLAISLPLRNPEDLADFLKQVYDPTSPNFRHYLTPEQFTERFGPTRENYQAVIDFVKSQGLTVTGTHSNRALVDVSGAVTDIERAFHVHLLAYNHPFESRTFYAPDVEPSVDTAAPILEVTGLDNYELPRPLYHLRSSNAAETAKIKPAFGSGPSGTLIGNDFRAAYVPGVTLTGTGQKIGLFEIDGYYTNDIAQYASQAGLTNVLAITNVLVDGFAGNPGVNNTEVALDIEMAMAMAPDAQIIVYESQYVLDLIERMASDNLAKQLSCSWSFHSGLGTKQIYQQMAAQGQTFFNASGDNGVYNSQYDIPADEPYVTTVGGTTLTTGSNGSWVSETAWSWAVTGEGNAATGGGISTSTAIPSWQQGINMANNNGSATMRNLPDVAMVADNMYVVVNNGQPEMLGGTSFSSPLWAAFTALVNQKAAAQSKQPVGFLNPILYAIGKSASYRTSFHDVVSGNNTNDGNPTKYFAIPGYDLCTGWGSPQTNLIDLLLNFQVPPLTNSAPRTIRVPADYATIQAAINAASSLTNDTVLVSPGTYDEAVNFNGKPALLVSVSGPNATFINPPAGSNAVTFASGETTNSIISGFTLTGGDSGAYVCGASPTIASNNIVNCGTGVYGYSSSPVILNNVISNSSGSAIYLYVCNSPLLSGNALVGNQGGGVSMTVGGSPTIINNLIQDNLGDAIIMSGYCNANIVQNVITGNTGNGISAEVAGARGPWVINNTISGNGGNGIEEDDYFSSCKIINNIVAGNPALYIGAVTGTNPPTIQFNDFYSANGNVYAGGVITNLNGIAGNISTNPFFACLSSGDFRLFTVSRCIDAGTNGSPLLPALDFNGNPRILTGNTNGSAIVDMGAYEFNPAAPPTPCLYINCPSNVVATAAVGQNSAVVTYPAPDATPTATVTCVPASGSVFPGGTNVVVCTVAYGSNTLTGTFTVTVLVPPYITNQPSFISVLANSTASITVGAFGTLPLSYQWTFVGTVIADATNSTLIVSNAQAINEGYYQVTIANSLGTATSRPILLRVLPSKALIVSGPQSISVPAGTQAAFNANVVGSAPLTLQWYKNGALLAGAVSSQLVISNAQAADAGTYQLLASNSLGTAISAGATLTVLPAKPSFILQPFSAAGLPGTSVVFESLAIGSDDGLNPIRYAWYFQSNQIPGQTSANLALASIVAANQGAYYVEASNIYGSATSAVVQLTVYQAPSLPNGFSNQVVDEGSNLVLNSGATGTPPLAYSWNFNTIALSNTTAFLSLPNITPLQAGYYSVTVTNQFGSVSGTGKVSVFLPASQVMAWGDDSCGQTDVPTNLADAVAVAGGDYHSVAIRHDGILVAWGFDDEGQIDVPTNILRFVSVAAGADHSLAIAEDGSVVAWGRDDSGQTDIPSTVSSVLSVAAGDSHSLALLASGNVVAWGDDTYGQTDIPTQLMPGYWVYYWGWYPIWVNNPNWMPVQAIAAGRNHNLALLTNGTVVAWGDNSFGQSSPPTNLTNVVAVTAGYLHSVALCSNGIVVAWGDNTFGETNVPPGLSNVVAIAAGDFHTLALLSNGTIVGWGDDTFGQLGVPSGATHVVGIASGYYHGLALVPFIQVLQAHLTRSGLVINWNGPGVLQWAPTPVGPYTDVLSQGNSWTNLNMSAPAKFFRVRR